MKTKNWKSFNENMSDNLLEILITLEEIKSSLKKSVNAMSISFDFDKISFEYHSGVVYDNNIAKNIKNSHYESVEITENGNFNIRFNKVVDNSFPHYTPKEISFDNKEELIKFLKGSNIIHTKLIKCFRKNEY